jgi:hypothetical protein
VPREQDRIAAAEFMVAGDFTVAGSTVAADFQAAGFTAGLADFTGDLLGFPTAGFTPANFMLMGFTASGSITMTSAAAWS